MEPLQDPGQRRGCEPLSDGYDVVLDNELTAAAAACTRLGDQPSIIKGRAQQALLLPGELLSVGDSWVSHCLE